MIIHPQIQGCVARNCHPIGCRAAVLQQIERIRAAGPFNGPKRVLVLGASSGFGLASRIALTFGAGADTVGVSFERGPSDKGPGSAGWYNNIWFRKEAEQAVPYRHQSARGCLFYRDAPARPSTPSASSWGRWIW